jgi:AraC family transcriptional regulator, positive regulator of tynA and feaB
MTVVFTTRDVHPRERLAYWREAMGVIPHEFRSSAGQAFIGTVTSATLADILIRQFDCDSCEVERDAHHIARGDGDGMLLSIQLSGKSVVCQDGRQAVNANGSFVVIDTGRPYTISFQESTRSLSLKLPRQAFEARLGRATTLTAQRMAPDLPLAGLMTGFLSMLSSRVEALPARVRPGLAEQALDLIALACSAGTDQPRATLSSPRAAALFRLKSVIEAQLGNPDLRPSAVAASAGVGVRYANDLLSQEGSSIERYIQHRRLERCRRALEDPKQARRMIGEIAFAWGFSDLSHFTRRFRAAYGLTPSDWRARALGGAPDAQARGNARAPRAERAPA